MRINSFKEFEQLNEEVKLSKVAKKEEFDGYTILIGRNAEMNDILTTEIADKDDIFLHVHDFPGSHVIIKKKDNEEIPKNVIKRAAELAAQNSRGKGRVDVVWTEIKNVTKDKKHKTGEVYVNHKNSNFMKINI